MKIYNTTRAAFQNTPLSRWKAAHLVHECAVAQLDVHLHDHLEPARTAYRAVRSQWSDDSLPQPGTIAYAKLERANAAYDPVKRDHQRLEDQANVAVDELIATPAPNVAALATKLEIQVTQACRGTRSADEVMRLLLVDARRLSGEA